MRIPRRFLVVVGLVAAGCASDESVICERLAECDLLLDGELGVSECEKQAVRQVPEERLEKCAECVEDEDCETLVEACGSLCEPGD